MKYSPLCIVDSYKLSHRALMDPKTEYIYSNLTPRSAKYLPVDKTTFDNKAVFFGLQHFIKDYLIREWGETFFSQSKADVIKAFKRRCDTFLGKDALSMGHFEELHDLGYLPISIKAIPEGARVNLRVPFFTIINTYPRFAWLTNYLETVISCELWKPCTTATIGFELRRLVCRYAMDTVGHIEGTRFQIHGFECRGMSGRHDAAISGAGPLLSSWGTDTLLSVDLLEQSYNADADKELIACSVPASEHSCTSLGTALIGELEFFRKAITKDYPTGIVSLVSDTYNFFAVITEFAASLKEDILARQPNALGLAKTVFRPDCYSDDTYVMTKGGWKLFKDVSENEAVAQVLDNETIDFVKPLKVFQSHYEGIMCHFSDFHGAIDLLVTPNHRMIYKRKGKWFVQNAEKCAAQGYYQKNILRAASYPNLGKTLSYLERLLIAFQADGSFADLNRDEPGKNIGKRTLVFNFQKKRKIDRLRAICKNGGFEHKISYEGARKGQATFYIWLDKTTYISKTFDWVDTNNLCSNWSKEFTEELKHWDGSIRNVGRFKYDSTIQSNLQVVEIVALAAGKGILISHAEDKRKLQFSDIYTAHIVDNPYRDGQSIKKKEVQYKGTVYCVQVPSGRLLVKRNRGIAVCGNSGDQVKIVCGSVCVLEIKDGDVGGYVKDLKTATDVAKDDIEQSVCDATPHGECGDGCPEGYFRYGGQIYKLTLNIDWNRHDKQHYYMDGVSVKSCERVTLTPEQKGAVECLWDIFGGTISSKGYKVLHKRVGLIYGDGCSPAIIKAIFDGLKAKGFASSNCIMGVGSYTFGCRSRDDLGMAIKATWAQVDGVGIDIYKDPVTDDGLKKSARGLLRVDKAGDDYVLTDRCTREQEQGGELREVFRDGKLLYETSLAEMRARIDADLAKTLVHP